jgi:hypothetical protein
MKTALEAAEELGSFLEEMRRNNIIPNAARDALEEDARYIKKSMRILCNGDVEAIRSLWKEVQQLSHFFGGDYAEGSNQVQLLKLMDEFQTALLEDMVIMRAKS